MRVISLNIREISKDKLTVLLSCIPQDTIVITLQETHCDEVKAKIVDGWLVGWKVFWGFGLSNSLEVALLLRVGCFDSATLVSADSRVVRVWAKKEKGLEIEWWSVYAPNEPSMRLAFFYAGWKMK